jgi:hypothetical protein
MNKFKLVVLTIFAVLVVIGCTNQSSNPAQATLNSSSNVVAQSWPQAFPGQTGPVDSGYYLGNKIYYNHINGCNVFQGDIVLADSQITKTPSLSKSLSAIRTGSLWPNSEVYFTIDADVANQDRIMRAMAHIQQHTHIVFLRRTYETNYINFRRSTIPGDYAGNNIGMHGGEQWIRLYDDYTDGIAIHEIGHAVNLFHEHTRTDGDNTNIKIKWANILHDPDPDVDWWSQFYTYTTYWSDGTNNGSYDFNSIMHYPCYAGSPCAINPALPIITKMDNTTWTTNNTVLSTGDINGINTDYAISRPQNRGYMMSAHDLRTNEYLLSYNQQYILYMQADGNLVLCQLPNWNVLWHTSTYNQPATSAFMQQDGNFIVYDPTGGIHWQSDTHEWYSYLILQDDGNLVIYDHTWVPKWSWMTGKL